MPWGPQAWLFCFLCWVYFIQPSSVFAADLILRKRVQSGLLAKHYPFRLSRKKNIQKCGGKKATAYWLLSKSIRLIKNSQNFKKVTIIKTVFWIWKLRLEDTFLAKMPWFIYDLRQHANPSRFISEGCNFINFPIVKNTDSRDFPGGPVVKTLQS